MKAAKLGFSLIEILIIVAIISILAILIITTLDPLEQINRGRDQALFQLAAELYQSTDRMYANNIAPPWNEEINAIVLTNDQGKEIIEKIISYGELQQGFIEVNSNLLAQIYLSTTEDYSKRSFCFLPTSQVYKQHEFTQFNASGDTIENQCPEEGCYLCVGTEYSDTDSDESQNDIRLSDMTEEELCADFDPEYPNFTGTTNISDTFDYLGCSHYAVHDRGCLSGDCPTGYRKLEKNYYRPRWRDDPSAWLSCILNWRESRESYCVPEPYARCDIHVTGYGTDQNDFEWGCSNPRRPMRWDPEQYPEP